jgi:hypothetical protein
MPMLERRLEPLAITSFFWSRRSLFIRSESGYAFEPE